MDDYTRLADDGCPHCHEHVPTGPLSAELAIEPDRSIIDLIRRKVAEGWRIVKLRMRWGSK